MVQVDGGKTIGIKTAEDPLIVMHLDAGFIHSVPNILYATAANGGRETSPCCSPFNLIPLISSPGEQLMLLSFSSSSEVMLVGPKQHRINNLKPEF
ncbi:hypothetical protein SLEP1_g9440 [Rubroshorea leprosula]|uniref:Uncharacterized protein n=1 Tax=Rubroshorea leprosula TaxID=152421 RepID=A0AAV5I4X4_9ROSI|nr:hypothetical protein SLEP1_g9440 [Rubroshorea leprosula]